MKEGFETNSDNKENLLENKIENNKTCIIIAVACLLVLIIVIFILIFIVFKKNNEEKPHKKDNDDKTELDTIPSEEFDRARKSFNQYNYTDIEDSSKILFYNLFIPEDLSNNEKYPLILFISDKSLVGKETTAPLTETVGGPIWATETVQKKHKCFVLVPQYNEEVVDGTWKKSEYLNVTLNLISKLEEKYSIDPNRIYGTGQSMGAMATLFLLANNDIFAAGLIADGHWLIDELKGLINATFTFCAAEGDLNPFNSQNEVKEYFDNNTIKYGSLNSINARNKVEILNNDTKQMYNLGYKQNFISYDKGSVLPPHSRSKDEHMASFKYTYRIEAVRDWIFEQIKGKIE